jgi:hypothetical protein
MARLLPEPITIYVMNFKNLKRLLCAFAAYALVGCATSEVRHSPADIARYQPADFVAPIASRAGAAIEHAEALAKIARAQTPDATFAQVGEALWAIKFMDSEHATGRMLIARALPRLAAMTASEQRAILSAAYALDAAGAAPILQRELANIATPREFAIAAYTLLKGAGAAENVAAHRALIREQIASRFGVTSIANLDLGEPRLLALLAKLDGAHAAPAPALKDLLAAPLVPGLPVVYSFQRQGRQHFGVALVRGADGRFVRNADGSLFYVPQLALALTGLPGTITNGNTPQGLFTIVGAGTATNKWIGPTPYLESRVPHEAKLGEFFHSDIAGEWRHENYTSLLPASWRGYGPFQEAYLAGRAGRDEMILHGTTINPEYYRNQSYYPGTPSAGCLVAMEYWSGTDGRLVQSDQLALLKAFTVGGKDRGYLIVVELDARLAPVTIEEVSREIVAAGL